MAITRRTFLRVLGAAIVGIAAAPEIIVAPPASPPTWWSAQLPAGDGGALTWDLLQRAYEMVAIHGGNTPTTFLTTKAVAAKYQTLAREVGLIFDLDIAA